MLKDLPWHVKQSTVVCCLAIWLEFAQTCLSSSLFSFFSAPMQCCTACYGNGSNGSSEARTRGTDARGKRVASEQRLRHAREDEARAKSRQVARERQDKALARRRLETPMERLSLTPWVEVRPAKLALAANQLWTCACGRDYPAHHSWTFWYSHNNNRMYHCEFCHQDWLHGINRV